LKENIIFILSIVVFYCLLAAMRTTGQYKSIRDLVQKLYQAEGWRFFYRGYFANSLGGKN